MNCFIALLRGVNVGGHNKIRMAELANALERNDFADVRTYIQSGNIVFRAKGKRAAMLANRFSQVILDEFDLEIPVLIRSAANFREAVEANPFIAAGAEQSALYFGFLSEKPKAALIEQLDPDLSPGDEFHVIADTIYTYCPNGLARTKLSNVYFDRKLKVSSTFRNWNTVQRLLAMSEESSG